MISAATAREVGRYPTPASRAVPTIRVLVHPDETAQIVIPPGVVGLGDDRGFRHLVDVHDDKTYCGKLCDLWGMQLGEKNGPETVGCVVCKASRTSRIRAYDRKILAAHYVGRTVACTACGRVVRASPNGHPRKHSPTNRLQHRDRQRNLGVCAGVALLGEKV